MISATSLSSDSYVVNCYFYSITYSGNGAAIYLSKSGVHFLVEFSTFVECSATGSFSYGGGIYIGYADFAMNHVCAIECKSSYYYSFTLVTNSGRTVNSIHHSSIAECVAQSSYTIHHSYGYIDIQSVNLSHNIANSYSALYCEPTSTNGRYGTSIRYSTFTDNLASSQYCVYLSYRQSNKYMMSNSNIIRNRGDRTICTSGYTDMVNCCIMRNTGNYVFDTHYGGFTLTNCSVDDNINSYNSKPTTNNIGSDSFINDLTFISIGDCEDMFSPYNTTSSIVNNNHSNGGAIAAIILGIAVFLVVIVVAILIYQNRPFGDDEDANYFPALHEACQHGHLQIAQFLVQKGADIEERDYQEKTPLHYASLNGDVKIINYLVEKGANKRARDKYGKTPYDYAKNEDTQRLLIT